MHKPFKKTHQNIGITMMYNPELQREKGFLLKWFEQEGGRGTRDATMSCFLPVSFYTSQHSWWTYETQVSSFKPQILVAGCWLLLQSVIVTLTLDRVLPVGQQTHKQCFLDAFGMQKHLCNYRNIHFTKRMTVWESTKWTGCFFCHLDLFLMTFSFNQPTPSWPDAL